MKRTSFVAFLAAACLGPRPVSAQCETPSLLIVLDKSSSMVTGTVPGGDTKWDAARAAVSTITSRFDTSIDFGLLVFPNPNHCDVSGVAVPVGPGTASAIAGYLADPPPAAGNYTPMWQAFDVAAGYAPMSDPSERRIAVLVSDGWQWCDPYDPATRFHPVEHAAALRATGTTVYVVGFGDSVDALTLNRIAYQSGTYVPGCDPTGSEPTTPNPCYQKAEDTAELEAVLDAIARHATTEVCDGIDNDCDDETDEDLARACSTVCGDGLETCRDGAWVDCTAPAPAASEACDGAVDEDCDGVVDEGCDCVSGETRSCGVDAGECVSGTQACAGGSWDECAGFLGPAAETCDGTDEDCDGTTDEGCLCAEGDVRVCGLDVGSCAGGTQTCSGGAWGGCDGAVVPTAEVCDDEDNDCDGMADEGCSCTAGATRPCGTDTGECTAGQQVCAAGTWSGCDGAAWPAAEACNGLDDDCNGTADDGASCPPGASCRAGVCTEGNPEGEDPPLTPPEDGGSASGCGCAAAGGAGWLGLVVLGLAIALALAGRSRRKR
ncbi:MAG: VWA domain-containing protein [Deltaproteobacteria bacterium]|nr:VWA domain-containing protein [Deltaproteobacteria bacterium]